MTEQPFSLPNFTPLTRLHVQDSLRINAERWTIAHNYHRQRQNLHYQALWQPGIVCGLGVKTINPPAGIPSQFRDARWIEIQPGLAIDLEGNPIVVSADEDRTYRIAAPAPLEGTRLLHVVLRYVDPDTLELDVQSDRVVERFRFDQRIGKLHGKDIELCRILLVPGETQLAIPQDPGAPGPNELDIRYRPIAQLRSQQTVHLGSVTPLSQQQRQQWLTLLDALPNLQNTLSGHLLESAIAPIAAPLLLAPDLVRLAAQTLWQIHSNKLMREWEALQHYLQTAGLLYVEAPEFDATLLSLLNQLGQTTLASVPPEHLLRRQPFHFGPFPQGDDGSIELMYGGGILLAKPSLAAAWSSARLPRHEIRACQELGANILHWAWQRRHFRNLLS